MSGVLGKYKIEVDTGTIADGDSIASYLVDSAGALLTSTLSGGRQALDVNSAAEHAEDAAHVSGDIGHLGLAVRHDADTSMVGTDGDYAPLQVDASGRLKVAADLTVTSDFVYAEDSAAASGDLGASVLAVRQDTLASSTSLDGDYGAFKQNNKGELYVINADGNASLVSILADTTAILADTATIDSNIASLLSEVQGLSQAEDAVHVSGDMGIMSLAVRNDANAVLTTTDGDYSPIAVDSAGRLKVVASVSIAAEHAEDSAHTTGDIGSFALGVRQDANGAAAANGDYVAFLVNSAGDLKVNDRADGSNLQQLVAVSTTAVALPAASLSGRKHLLIQNQGSRSIFVGSATVTAAGATQGVEVPKNSFWEGDVGPGNVVYAITASGSANVIVWELS